MKATIILEGVSEQLIQGNYILNSIGEKNMTKKEDSTIDGLEVDDAGKPLYLHASNCPGYCDYACNTPQGEQVAEALEDRGHDENCDTRDRMIPGKTCNCYVRVRDANAIARKAIDHVLKRVRNHEYIGYFMGDLTESFELLTEAFAALHEVPLDFVENQFRPKSPRKPQDEDVSRELANVRRELSDLRQFGDCERQTEVERLKKVITAEPTFDKVTDSLRAEIVQLKQLDEVGAKAHNANLLEMNRLHGYLRDAVNALEAMPGTAEEWHKYIRWAESLRTETVERIKRELSI